MSWDPIYDDPEFWNPEKLIQESAKFQNVATCFGRTHVKDDKGNDLYLNCLDIDSDGVYKILFDLENHGKQYSFIAEAMKKTFVTKTRKSNGYHVYWFSHQEYRPIVAKDCKPGLEFEIKTGKMGLCTLPGSTHRDDHNFRYKNYGHETIIISDDMHRRIVEVLEHCIQPRQSIGRIKTKSYIEVDKAELSDTDIQTIAECIRPYYKKGRRHSIVFGLSGVLHKSGVSKDSAVALVETISKGDNEHDVRTALKTVEVFGNDANIVAGTRYLSDALVAVVGNSAITRGILDKIFRIIGKENPYQWLTRAIMNEYTFKNTTDNEDIYCYDDEKGGEVFTYRAKSGA
jgi:hypothetical protein